MVKLIKVIFLIQIFLITLFSGINTLKNVHIVAPEAVKAGKSLKLQCEYDLENAPLYSVKWYFGHDEFYRYVPKESPPTRVFIMPGISVDVSQSNDHQVTLNYVQRELSGFYQCEVSADAPSFHTDIKSSLVVVTEEPRNSPEISKEKLKYSNTETIKVNCTSSNGFPAANITWFINGKQINVSEDVKSKSSIQMDSKGLETIRSQLYIKLKSNSNYFKDGEIQLTCQATQFEIYKENAQLTLFEDTPKLARVLSPSSPNRATRDCGEILKNYLNIIFLLLIVILS